MHLGKLFGMRGVVHHSLTQTEIAMGPIIHNAEAAAAPDAIFGMCSAGALCQAVTSIGLKGSKGGRLTARLVHS